MASNLIETASNLLVFLDAFSFSSFVFIFQKSANTVLSHVLSEEHPLPLAQDRCKDIAPKNKGVVGDAHSDIEAEEENHIRDTQNANGNVAHQQQLPEGPLTCILLVSVDADQGANRSSHSQSRGVKHHRKMRAFKTVNQT